jgi:hypothetical protein
MGYSSHMILFTAVSVFVAGNCTHVGITSTPAKPHKVLEVSFAEQ